MATLYDHGHKCNPQFKYNQHNQLINEQQIALSGNNINVGVTIHVDKCMPDPGRYDHFPKKN